MPIIHEHILQQIKDSLGDHGIKLSEDVFYQDINSLINSIIVDELQDKDLQELRVNIFKNKFQKTKKRWFKSLEKMVNDKNNGAKKGEILGEIEYAKDFIERFSQEQFEYLYKVKTIDELKIQRLNEIKEWSENPEQKLIDYPYIKDKPTLSLKTAIQTDILIIALNIYIQKYGGSMNIYMEYPDQLLSIPAFSPQRGKLNFSSTPLLIDGIEYYAQPYTVADGIEFNTVVWKEDVDKGIISDKELRMLDHTDEAIYDVVIGSRNNIEFIKDRSIYVNVGEVVKKVFNSDAKNRYDAVVTRMNKMAHVKFTFQSKNKEKIIFGIFDNIQWDQDEKTAIVKVNEILQKQIIERQVTLMYRDVINKLQIDLPKTLIFAVQKERLRKHIEEESTRSIFSYDFFVYRLQFKKRSKKANINIIKSYLDEMKKEKVIIADYSLQGDNFIVDFIPVIDYEIKDILTSTNRKMLN